MHDMRPDQKWETQSETGKQGCLETDCVLISTVACNINTHLLQAMNTIKTPPITVVPRWHLGSR